MGGIILILFWNCFRGKVQVHFALSIFIISTFEAHTYLNCVSAYNPASEFMYFISYHNLNEKRYFSLVEVHKQYNRSFLQPYISLTLFFVIFTLTLSAELLPVV